MNINVIKKIFPIDNCNNIHELKYDSEGLWSISHPNHANKLSEAIKSYKNLELNTILDSTAGLGGNTLSFAKKFNKVISIEYNFNRFKMLSNNVKCYDFNNIELYHGDLIDLITKFNEKIDIVFVDPPWGGPNYKEDSNLKIELSNKNLAEVTKIISNYNYQGNKVKLIVYKLPYNFKLIEITEECKHIILSEFKITDGNIIYLFLEMKTD